ncbi:hypothetical protein MYX76_05335 [Desulfobacterota bacterium AH_259_B03_O07]|nr:hypothetical protein [Desulfobacterota bacterium AH_259_B03_O07]
MSSNSISPEIEALTIVALGRFNPAIFHPSWFSKIHMFSETEINQALEEFKGVVHKDITDFQIYWCRFVVEPTRIIVTTRMDAYFERLRDLLYATFKELIHTPITAVGINPEADFKAPSRERWDNFGHRLAPKDDWHEITGNPGLRELIIEDKPRADKFTGYTQIKIKPSEKIENGIYIHMNDHHSFENYKLEDGAKHLLEVLEEGFPNTMKRWEKIHKHLTSLI